MADDKRLIEDYLPIKAIGRAAVGEPRTKGHISTLHLWRARRPLVACRAAVYGALVPASRFIPENGPDEKKRSLGRANAARFLGDLCTYPDIPSVTEQARQHILQAHAERLTEKTGKPVAVKDIVEGRAPRPKVLDMFAGGGAIPLEALRLGCEAYALDLNPVAHLIELCTITYPQQFGANLADDVEEWGRKVVDRTRAKVSDLYPVIEVTQGARPKAVQTTLPLADEDERHVSIVAFYWTRTAPCKNAKCRGTVPLYRQTWLRNKGSGYVALRPKADRKRKRVRFKCVEAASASGLGFDPGEGMKGTTRSCPFCQTTLDAKYIRTYGDTHGFGQQLMCVIAKNPHGSGKLYLADETLADGEVRRQEVAEARAQALEKELGSSSLDEVIPPTGNAGLATGKSYLYGIHTFRQAFTPRQRCVLLTMARELRAAHTEMIAAGIAPARATAVATYLGLWLSRLTDRFNGLARWDNTGEKVQGLTSLKRFAMSWDFPEVNIFGGASGDALGNLGYVTAVIRREAHAGAPALVARGSATSLPFTDGSFDAVITDPPYYDNESYSELSDVCYVWLRPTIGHLYPEHFAGSLTPKKQEVVAAAYRQGGTKEAAYASFEDSLARALAEARRVLKPNGVLVMIYAHKSKSGWATVVDAIRRSGFEVAEAWPIAMEGKARVAHQGDAALGSNVFIVARKRETGKLGQYETEVRPELERIVRERVNALWSMSITGADLDIAAVGAGLRAFTKFDRVEYANGEEVEADRFLGEVEGLVHEFKLAKIFGLAGTNVSAVDGPSRFYVLWCYTYKAATIDAGEAIVFTYGQNVELDGQQGLSAGKHALVEKKKGKYRLRDFTERGDHEKLGFPEDDGSPAPLIDALHRVLWLVENRPRSLNKYLDEAHPDGERLRLVAQALAGAGLSGKTQEEAEHLVATTASEQAALKKLLANWRSLIEQRLAASEGPLFT